MKKWLGLIALFLFCLGIIACRGSEDENDKQNNIQVYYLNREETAIKPVDYVLQSRERTDMVSELLNLMCAEPDDNDLKAPISADVQIYSCRINENKLIIDFAQKL